MLRKSERVNVRTTGIRVIRIHYTICRRLNVISTSENELQRLSQIVNYYNGRILTDKTKAIALRGKQRKRTKIVLNRKTLEQISHLNYLSCSLSYEPGHENRVQ